MKDVFDVSFYQICLLLDFIEIFLVYLFCSPFWLFYLLYFHLFSWYFFLVKFSLLDYFFMFIYICFINLWKSALSFTVRSNKVYLLIDSWTDFWSNFIPWIFYNFIMIFSIEQPSPLTFFSILNLSLCLVSR